MDLSRRALLATTAAMAARAAHAQPDLPPLRLGTLQFGTVQWVADIIRRHDLDIKHGFALRGSMLANTDAGRVSLMAGASDVILSDWPFVAVQRAVRNQVVLCAVLQRDRRNHDSRGIRRYSAWPI